MRKGGENMVRYVYNGPVLKFGVPITKKNWKAITMAKDEKKAISNLTYRAKMQMSYAKDSNLKLDIKYLKKELV